MKKQNKPSIITIDSGTEEQDEQMLNQQIEKIAIKEVLEPDETIEKTTSEPASTIMIETTDQSQYEAIEQPEPPRRGNRIRPKTAFYGNNMMFTQLTNSPRSEGENPEAN